MSNSRSASNERRRKRYLASGNCSNCGKRPPSAGMITCQQCRDVRKSYLEVRRSRSLCTGCGSREKVSGRHCGSCAIKLRYRNKRKRDAIKDQVFLAYGGYRCSCPGCDVTEKDFLTIDHVDGGGLKHRRVIGVSNLYRWLRRNNFPPGFQVLCFNCNQSKGRRGGSGICAHLRNRGPDE